MTTERKWYFWYVSKWISQNDLRTELDFSEKLLISVTAFFILVRYTSLLFILCHITVKEIVFSYQNCVSCGKRHAILYWNDKFVDFSDVPMLSSSTHDIWLRIFFHFFFRLHWILGKIFYSLIERFLLDDWSKIHDVFFFNSHVIFSDIIISGEGSLRILLDSRFLSMSISGDSPPILTWTVVFLSYFVVPE